MRFLVVIVKAWKNNGVELKMVKRNTSCDKCNCKLQGVGVYSLEYVGTKFFVCGKCMNEILRKELNVNMNSLLKSKEKVKSK